MELLRLIEKYSTICILTKDFKKKSIPCLEMRPNKKTKSPVGLENILCIFIPRLNGVSYYAIEKLRVSCFGFCAELIEMAASRII